MELSDFIRTAIHDIVHGVYQANNTCQHVRAEVNPIPRNVQNGTLVAVNEDGKEVPVTMIEFDIAVTVGKGSESKAGLSIFAAAFAIGAAGMSNEDHSQVHRLKFSVPVRLPTLQPNQVAGGP